MHTYSKTYKRILTSSLTIILVLSLLTSPIQAADSDDVNYDYALKLKELGVFVGTGSGFELSRTPKRIEGIVMLVRLLGKEADALKMSENATNFTDVPSWALGYVNYAKSKGLTNGVSATEFGSDDLMSAEMYVSFLLRSLGYDDSKGDFNWKESLSKAKSIGMISSTNTYTSTTFIRSHIAKLSYDTLLTNYKNSTTSLAQYLVNIGALNEKTAVAINLIDNPAVVNGKLYALKDSDFYDIGENDCYVDVVASATITNASKENVYVHKGEANKASNSLLNIAISNYDRLYLRFVHENSDPSDMLHILNGRVTTIAAAKNAKPYKSYSITESSQYISLDLSSIAASELSLYLSAADGGTIFIYNLFLE